MEIWEKDERRRYSESILRHLEKGDSVTFKIHSKAERAILIGVVDALRDSRDLIEIMTDDTKHLTIEVGRWY